MIMTVTELRQIVTTTETDTALQFLLEGLTTFVSSYTNNSFIDRQTEQPSYPADVKLGVVNLVKWELSNRDKVGVSSETISRHSVSYSGLAGNDSVGGYPAALIGFLKPYMKARF